MNPLLQEALADPGPITAWSYSRLNDYLACPRKTYYKYVEKRPEPSSPAMVRGTAIHSKLEHYLNWEIEEVPREGFFFKDSLEEIRMENAVAEEQWAFRSDWSRCDWLDPHVWLRLKIDAGVALDGNLHTIDFKTGKIRLEHQQQLELYALASMKLRPGYTAYMTEAWYLDQNERSLRRYEPHEESLLQDRWEAKVAPMMREKRFDPTPNSLCKWCHFRKANGGPCEF